MKRNWLTVPPNNWHGRPVIHGAKKFDMFPRPFSAVSTVM